MMPAKIPSEDGIGKENGVEEYRVSPNTIFSARLPLRVVVVGAGIAGIAAVYKYHRVLKHRNVSFTIYEKNADVGGTWLENRYPGYVTCTA